MILFERLLGDLRLKPDYYANPSINTDVGDKAARAGYLKRWVPAFQTPNRLQRVDGYSRFPIAIVDLGAVNTLELPH